MAELKRGDMVRLKSGGPLMTVVELGVFVRQGPQDAVRCQWFDGKRREEELFDKATLETSDNEVRSVRIERG